MVKLTQDQIQFYKDNGYIILRNIFTKEEIKEFVDEYDRLFYEKNNPGMETAWEATHISAMANHESYSVSFKSIDHAFILIKMEDIITITLNARLPDIILPQSSPNRPALCHSDPRSSSDHGLKFFLK